MRRNRQSEIAIGILVACARSPMRKIKTLQAAEASAATRDHAAQVVNLLVHEGFLRTERGRQGGIALAVPATEILLGDVLRRVQPDLVRHAGKDDPSGNNATLPVFDAIVGAAEATFLTFMDRFSIADLVSDTASKRIDCLDCELLNPARRKRDETAVFKSTLYHQNKHTLHEQKESLAGIIVAERARTERSHHHVNSSR